MEELPAELQIFGAYIDAQPQPVREAFQYCFCLMMVESGGMQLVKTLPGDEGELCYFETSAGEAFTIPRPAITAEQEAGVIEMLREILRDEGLM
jgi:hypothetical protein